MSMPDNNEFTAAYADAGRSTDKVETCRVRYVRFREMFHVYEATSHAAKLDAEQARGDMMRAYSLYLDAQAEAEFNG